MPVPQTTAFLRWAAAVWSAVARPLLGGVGTTAVVGRGAVFLGGRRELHTDAAREGVQRVALGGDVLFWMCLA